MLKNLQQQSRSWGCVFVLCALFCLLYPSKSVAFEQHCIDQYEKCLDKVNKQLFHARTDKHRAHLQLKKAVLQVIFGHYRQAQPLLLLLVSNPYLSELEQIEAIIYHAKNYYAMNNAKLGSIFSMEAESLISLIDEQKMNVDLSVEYANVLIYNGKLKDSWQVLSALLEQAEEGVRPQVMSDLYANLGHLAVRLDRNHLLLGYCKKAYYYILKVDNIQQWGIASHNLALAFVANLNFTEAHKMFVQAIDYSTRAGNISSANYTRYRLAEMNYTMGFYPIARKQLLGMLASDLSGSTLTPPAKLRELLELVNDQLYTSY